MPKRTSYAPLILAIVLLLLPVLYVGSYLALVVPKGHWQQPDGTYVVSYYRIPFDRVAVVFWPLEQIDRKLRPGAWEITFWSELNVINGPIRRKLLTTPPAPKPGSPDSPD